MKIKELQESILVFRFNRMIAAGWSSKDIDFIRIVTREDIAMELLAVIALAPPKHFTSSAIEKEKRRVLRRIQKDSHGNFLINNTRWRGTAFYIEKGDHIPESFQGILIVYKSGNFYGDKIPEPNGIFLPIPPNEDFYINLNYKAPGHENYWASVRVPMVPSKNVCEKIRC